MYDIRWDESAKEDMKRLKLRAYEVAQVVDAVDEELTHQAERATKRKKLIRPEEHLPFEHLDPVWQLRVGEFRVFYDVSKQPEQEAAEGAEYEGVVHIRAVRRKPGHKTTKEIL
jgi:mRNA-degrading endonuclease RelE of RelBE toxin-antitoxin system